MDQEDAVTVPELSFQLIDEHVQQLQEVINPLGESFNHGIELYEQTLLYIHSLLDQNPQLYRE